MRKLRAMHGNRESVTEKKKTLDQIFGVRPADCDVYHHPLHQPHQSRYWLPLVQRSWQVLDARPWPSFPASLTNKGQVRGSCVPQTWLHPSLSTHQPGTLGWLLPPLPLISSSSCVPSSQSCWE